MLKSHREDTLHMDELDKKILSLLNENARMTLKEMAGRVSLTSPAVAERIRRMERSGVIAGYTVRIHPQQHSNYINAIISVYIHPKDRPAFHQILDEESSVEECFQVTGQNSHMVRVCCRDIPALDTLLNRIQKLGQTNTEIILSTFHRGGLSHV